MQAADRKQMGQPGIAHRRFVGLADRAAISARQRRCNAGRRAVHMLADMGGQRALRFGKGGTAVCAFDQLDRAHQRSRRRQPVEPGGAREIVGAGQDRRRRGHKPGFQPQASPLFHGLRRAIQRHVDPHLHRPALFRIAHGQRQPNALLGGLILTFEHAPVEREDARIGNRFGTDHCGARPDRAHAQRQHTRQGNGRDHQLRPVLPPPPCGQRTEAGKSAHG